MDLRLMPPFARQISGEKRVAEVKYAVRGCRAEAGLPLGF